MRFTHENGALVFDYKEVVARAFLTPELDAKLTTGVVIGACDVTRAYAARDIPLVTDLTEPYTWWYDVLWAEQSHARKMKLSLHWFDELVPLDRYAYDRWIDSVVELKRWPQNSLSMLTFAMRKHW